MNKKTILISVLVVAVIIVIAVFARKPKEEALVSTDQTTITPSSSTTKSNSTVKTNTSTTPLVANTLVILTPSEGEVLTTGSTANIAWDSSNDLKGGMVIITLLKSGKEFAAISEKEGIPADLKKFSWKVPDVSIWGEEKFSIKITTIGLKKNLTTQGGSFTIKK